MTRRAALALTALLCLTALGLSGGDPSSLAINAATSPDTPAAQHSAALAEDE